MKALKVLPFLFILTLFSCSSDSDDSNNGSNQPYNLTLKDGDYWTYDVTGAAGTSRDSLYVANDTVISGNSYKKFKTENLPTGFYSSSLNNNGVRMENYNLLLSGSLDFGAIQGLPTNISISLDDFVIFNPNASQGTTLDTYSDSFQQTVGTFPLTINYTLKSTAGNSYTTFTSNGETYTNVKSTIITLNMNITTDFNGFALPVLSSQDVLVSEQLIAENIGVFKSNSTFSYTIDPLFASQISQFGIPASASQDQEELLDTYLIN